MDARELSGDIKGATEATKFVLITNNVLCSDEVFRNIKVPTKACDHQWRSFLFSFNVDESAGLD